jgi:ketosteroid isomerase-like protein
MNRIRALLAALLLCLAPWAQAQAPAGDEAIHDELRGLLRTVASAINERQYERLLPILSDSAHVVLINQDVIARKDQMQPYLDKWFGDGGYLKSLTVKLEADVLTELSPDRTWGMAYGTGVEDYRLADGRSFAMPTRWTAVVQKEADGAWRIRAVHVGTNFLDNPVLHGVAGNTGQWLALGGAGGLVVGGLLTWLVMRRRKSRA